jgi:hypothetical protein
MALYVVRVWLPDRPGALGQVASRIGAVRGDVVGIEILERGGGRAIDELVVHLPDDGLVELLVAEIAQVDGVDVEAHDAQLAALVIAEHLTRAAAAQDVLEVLCRELAEQMACEWATVVRLDPPGEVAVAGEAPGAAWLVAFLDGSRHLDTSEAERSAPPDMAWAALHTSGLELAVGRRSRAFRRLERQQLALLARVADGLLAARGPLASPDRAGGASRTV